MTKPPTIIPYSNTHVIAAPKGEESCYIFSIRKRDAAGGRRAVLTYELANCQSTKRGLLLTDEAAVLEGEAEKALFKQFCEDLWTMRGARLATAKSVVNHVYAGGYGIDEVKVAVHTFGPVPVFVLNRLVNLPLHGETAQARIGLSPRNVAPQSGPKRTRFTPSCFNGDSEFRAAMSINPALIFRRYFEDIAEDFHDIRRTLSLEKVYQRVKGIETTIGSSIESKLDKFLPKANLSKERDDANREKWAFFCANTVQLYEAAIVRGFALYLLNELYSILGIFSRADEYREYIHNRHGRIADLLGEQEAYELRQSSEPLHYLTEFLTAYEAGKRDPKDRYEKARELLSMASEVRPSWCAEFGKFAEFVLLIYGYRSKRARLFISYHVDVPASETLKKQIARHVSDKPGRTVLPIAIERLPAGAALGHVVRSAIWRVQGVIAICPANTTEISKPTAKGYKWIARECEHALLLNKRVLLGTQAGSNHEHIKADFSKTDLGYLVRGSKLADDQTRAAALLAELQNVHADFDRIDTTDGLDSKLANHITDFARMLSTRAMGQILDGYVRQFELRTQKALIYSLKAARHRGRHSRRWFIKALTPVFNGNVRDARNAFDQMRKQVKARGIDIMGKKISLLAQPHEGEGRDKDYYERLSKVIRALLPSAPTIVEIRLEAEKWLATWENRLPVAGRDS